jgi:hypothetical protein
VDEQSQLEGGEQYATADLLQAPTNNKTSLKHKTSREGESRSYDFNLGLPAASGIGIAPAISQGRNEETTSVSHVPGGHQIN